MRSEPEARQFPFGRSRVFLVRVRRSSSRRLWHSSALLSISPEPVRPDYRARTPSVLLYRLQSSRGPPAGRRMALRFDARDLVRPPYRPFPKCGGEMSGVYHVGPQGYSRRCRECWHKGEFPLWPFSRKVIYIDQFAISNTMKAGSTLMTSCPWAARPRSLGRTLRSGSSGRRCR
jgi:hypothetical protein